MRRGHYRRSIAALTATAVLLPMALPVATAAPAVVTIDTTVVHQTIDGFGSTVRLWDDPHLCDCFDATTQRGATVPQADRATILQLIYQDLGLTRIRPATEGGIEVTNDNNDPNVVDPSKFNFAWKRNDGYIDFVKQAATYAPVTHFLSPIELEAWMDEGNPDEYVEWALTILKRWRDQGLTPRYYSIINEPGYSRGGIWSKEYIATVIKSLGPKLSAEGLQIKFVISDDLNAAQAYERCAYVLQDPQARKYVGALAYHLYGGSAADKQKVTALAQQYGIPVWMTEYSSSKYVGFDGGLTWARQIHSLLADYDVSAVDYMWAFFGEWSEQQWPGDSLVRIKFNGLQYAGYSLTERYYFTGQYARHVRPGAARVDLVGAPAGVEMTAFKEGTKLVVVAINTDHNAQAVQVVIKGTQTAGSWSIERTSATDKWSALPGVSDSAGFSTTLAAKSVTTFLNAPVAQGDAGAGAGTDASGSTVARDAGVSGDGVGPRAARDAGAGSDVAANKDGGTGSGTAADPPTAKQASGGCAVGAPARGLAGWGPFALLLLGVFFFRAASRSSRRPSGAARMAPRCDTWRGVRTVNGVAAARGKDRGPAAREAG